MGQLEMMVTFWSRDREGGQQDVNETLAPEMYWGGDMKLVTNVRN
jgi:hypothetical protein